MQVNPNRIEPAALEGWKVVFQNKEGYWIFDTRKEALEHLKLVIDGKSPLEPE